MRKLLRALFAVLVFLYAIDTVLADEEPIAQPTSVSTPTSNPKAAFDRLVKASDWRERDSAAKELAAFGEPGMRNLQQGAQKNEDAKVRRKCFEMLAKDLKNYPWAGETLARYGLKDSDPEIRYVCAFNLGSNKVYASHYWLRQLMNDKNADERTRLTAAKSLAELGEPDVMGRLYRSLTSDGYMDRYIANLGIKALSGKDLNDFEEYDYAEGAFVSGGIEAVIFGEEPEHYAERVSKRYQAVATYCKWLKDNRPDLYKHLSYWLN